MTTDRTLIYSTAESTLMARSARSGGVFGKTPAVYRVAPYLISAVHLADKNGIEAMKGRPIPSNHTESYYVLDFGSGHTDRRVVSICDDVRLWTKRQVRPYATEQGVNFNPMFHTAVLQTTIQDGGVMTVNASLKWAGVFDFILLSNVVNVQPDMTSMFQLGQLVHDLLAPGGIVLWNYPASPRYSGLCKTAAQFYAFTQNFVPFNVGKVIRVHPAPLWQSVKAPIFGAVKV